ncbi:unnamed protein product [Leptidea sinapis]|uniref:Uncharacterized protein n=1 Tax=Leptidea sinapis TaxID=189913 RepID=A0A5E4QEK6_9NEOP|nr:unnamed protein product [Leptidea sinapis]
MIIAVCLMSTVLAIYTENKTIFRDDLVIFTSNHNITKLLVPADGVSFVRNDNSDLPAIFFTIKDKNLDGEHCIYVLEGLAAYEILEGGRDSTADYGPDKTVYFGAKDGVYKYDPDSLSAKKFGLFRDDIIQIQKANGEDVIYYLTVNYKLFKLENNGVLRTRIEVVTCALEFVLDTSNNIYYLACEDGLPRIVSNQGLLLSFTPTLYDDFKDVKLLRPAFIMERSVLFFADGFFYMLYVNGTTAKRDFFIDEKPTAFSIDAALYLVAAVEGKIFEFNVMEVLLKSIFHVSNAWPNDLTKIMMPIIENSKENKIFNFMGIS